GLFSLSVANGGKPIPESALQRLFQPFYRGEAKSRQQGLGLGLFIASEIARAHGGSLDVVSDVEQTRFSLHIPAN
ncbi:MAG: sensor histidine kinase, partial [Mesorhizobium sp.]